MLAYAGKAQFVIESVDLSDVARETVYLAQASIPKSVSLHLDLAESLPAIQADRSQVQQVVLNLVLNAAEAIGDRSGRISIRTAAETIGTRPFRSALGGHIVAPGRYASIEITDTGCGMDDKTRSRIFDPFFTTKFTGRGLGLAAVAGVVRGHKGAVRVTSTPGKGTKFTVLFPASGDCVRRAKVPDFKVAEQQPGRGGILVVDDEPMVLRTAKIALERRGYRVFVADSGPSAIELIEKDGDAIDLVLLDLSMPGMSGEETFLQLQKRKPGVRALISSGYSELEMRRHFSGQKIAGFVQKPYTALGLAEYVKSALT
jgi:CheY-like chemotaxis protein